MANSSPEDDKVLNRLARYFKGTPSLGLRFTLLTKPLRFTLCGFFDSSLGDRESSKSTGAWLLAFGSHEKIGGVIAGKCFVQRLPAHSSLESEFYSLDELCKAIAWARPLLANVGRPQQGPTIIYTDCQGVIDISKIQSIRRGQGTSRYVKIMSDHSSRRGC